MVDPLGLTGIGRSLRRLARHLPDPVRDALRDRETHDPGNASEVATDPKERRPELSVVVAAEHGNTRLDACLAALAAQTLRRIEVVVVGVGSADSTAEPLAEVAARWAAADARFTLASGVHPHRPAAWNAGARRARGDYLAFLEATDIVPPAGYATLVGSLRATGSDFAAGGLQEFRLGRPRRPSWALPTHDLDRPGRTLDEFADAVLDVALTNRVFRAAFWRRSVGGFAEDSDHSEPYAVVTAALAAARFDFLKRVTTVHHPATAAVLPGRPDLAELEQRLHWWEAALALTRQQAEPAVSGRLLGRFVDVELGDLATRAAGAEPAYRDRLQQTAMRSLAAADGHAWPDVRVERKLRFWHAAHGQWAELVATIEHFRLAGTMPRTRVEPALPEARIRLDGLPDPAQGTIPPPPECLELGRAETGLTGCIERLAWNGPVLTVEGWAFIAGVDLAGTTAAISASLTEIDSRRTHPVEVRLQPRPAANRWSRLHYHDVANGGFVLTVDTGPLPTPPGRWQLGLTVRTDGVTRVGLLQNTVLTGAAGLGAARPVVSTDDPVRMIAHLDREHGFCVQVRADAFRVVELATSGSAATARVLRLGAGRPAVAVHATSSTGHQVEAPCDEGGGFVLDLPTGRADSWSLRAEDDRGRRHRISWPPESTTPGPVGGPAGPRWERSPRGLAELVTGPGYEALDVTADADSLVVVLRDDPATDWTAATLGNRLLSLPVGSTSTVGDRVELRFPVVASRYGGPVLPLPGGDYRVEIGSAPVAAAEELLTRLPVEHLTPSHLVQVSRGKTGRELIITFAGPRTEAERSRYGLHQLSLAYAVAAPAPTDSVLFQCYRGEFATDSQAAIHAELYRRDRSLDLIWGVHDLSVALPEGGRPLLIESAAWFDALAGSRFLCRNIDFERYFVKRPHQRYLQTFHGYPFKSMGASLWRTQGRDEAVIAAEQQRRSSAWDAICVPADFCVDLYRREYGYRGEALVTGYPRNDSLVTDDGAAVRRRVLDTLGIPPDKRVVLYAPTWRDTTATSAWTAAMFDALDLERLSTTLGDDYAVLLRGHNYNLREGFDLSGSRFWDVSAYPEVNDLILAADVAVLDYSSLRFDWAITGKPMVFFVPDLDDYLSARTVLFDFASTAPGPMLATTEAVAAALLDLDVVAAEYAAARTAFNDRFNTLHDGKAGRRVVDAFFT